MKSWLSVSARFSFILFLTGLVLNLAWENLHQGLYATVIEPMRRMGYLLCSIGDALLVLFAWFIVLLITGSGKFRPAFNARQYRWLLAASAAVAYAAEKTALALDWWKYKDIMPIIPGLEVGASPFLQIALTPGLAVWLSNLILRKSFFTNHNKNQQL